MSSLNVVPGAIDITNVDTSIINNDDSSNQECSTNDNNSLNVTGDASLYVCNECFFVMIQDEGNPNIDVRTNLPYTKKLATHATTITYSTDSI